MNASRLLTDRYIKVMKHCIGLDRAKPYKRHGKLFYRPFRNYFETGPNCDGVDIWLDLEKHGYAIRGFAYWEWTFMLTDYALDCLGEHLGVKIYNRTEY